MKCDFHIKEYVLFHIHRDIVNFYKTYLNLTQDLQRDHYILLKKVEERTDADFAKNIDYFDYDNNNYIRNNYEYNYEMYKRTTKKKSKRTKKC